MNQHSLSVHEGIKPFKCGICDYSSAIKNDLKLHIASVQEGNKPFKCELCNHTFSRKDVSNRHVESVQKGIKPIMMVNKFQERKGFGF